MLVKQILDNLGIFDRESLAQYYNSKKDNLTQADIDVLDPDKIDNKEFWRLATEIDRTSIVGGGAVESNDNITELNQYNSILAKTIGIFDYIIPHKGYNYKLLDIGCGYCPIKDLLLPQISYTGIDILPRTPDVIETDGNGIPNLGTFDYVVSCNVFQHLSERQKIQYTHDAFQCLNPGGYFTNAFMTSYGNYEMPTFNGDKHIFTCGQFLPVMSHIHYMQILSHIGFEVKQFNNRWDGFSCFFCRKPNVSTN